GIDSTTAAVPNVARNALRSISMRSSSTRGAGLPSCRCGAGLKSRLLSRRTVVLPDIGFNMNHAVDRRDFLRISGLAWLAALGSYPANAGQTGLAGGRLLGTLTLGGEGARPAPPFGELLGAGLDARLFTDLSS